MAFRFKMAWVIAKKDLLQFRRNRYIIFTLLLTPLLLSVLMPFISITPVVSLFEDNGDFNYIALHRPETYFNLNETGLPPGEFPYLNRYYVNSTELNYCSANNSVIVNSTVKDGLIMGSVIESSHLSGVFIKDSFILNSTVEGSSLINCTVVNSSLSDTMKRDSRLYNTTEPGQITLTDYISLMVDSMLFMFILIPAIVPTIIASYSFIGEKTGKTLEPVLSTPVSDSELFAGKAMAIFIPTMLATLVSFVLFSVLIDALTAPLVGKILLPDMKWMVAMLITAPVFCIMAIELNVFVSAKVNDVRAAQQIGGSVVLPVVVLFVMMSMGMIKSSVFMLLLLSLAVFLIDAAVFGLAMKMFKRERILVDWR